jgi:hypothetical protein
MKERPPFEPSQEEAQVAKWGGVLDFVKRLGRVLLVGFLGSALYALVFGPRTIGGFADGLFITGATLFIVALFPFLEGVFGRATLSSRSKDRNLDQVLEEQRERSQQGQTVAYLFGVSGVIIIALSLIVGFSVR